MLKPRIRMRLGVWVCVTFIVRSVQPHIEVMRMGHGDSPREAYEDWMAQG